MSIRLQPDKSPTQFRISKTLFFIQTRTGIEDSFTVYRHATLDMISGVAGRVGRTKPKQTRDEITNAQPTLGQHRTNIGLGSGADGSSSQEVGRSLLVVLLRCSLPIEHKRSGDGGPSRPCLRPFTGRQGGA